MKLGIMQPYFMPYIGYWQLLNAVDKYVVYDNIEYTKKGWFNRNRILVNGKDAYITIPIKKDSDYLDVCQREISVDIDKRKILNLIRNSYQKAPYYKTIYPEIENIIMCGETNLFQYIYNSILRITSLLQIKTEIIVSSTLDIDVTLKGKEKVLAISKYLDANVYLNAIGGQSLYNKQEFITNGIDLLFLQTNTIKYKQFANEFVPNLSIIDVLMFNSVEQVKDMLGNYTLQ